jgi:hypothetical protein
MAADWYFARQKQKLGPFSWDQLRQLAAVALLHGDDHVWQEGTPRWREAGTVEGLFPRETSLKSYRLSVGRQAYGPYTSEQVRGFLIAGRLSGTALAHAPGMAQWLPLAEIPEFAAYAARPVDSQAVLVVDPGHEMTREEAELHLAGKGGDPLARLVSRLMDLKRRFSSHATLQLTLDQSIRKLLELREQRGPWGAVPGPRPSV